MFEDITYDASWSILFGGKAEETIKHFNGGWRFSTGFEIYEEDFFPAVRHERRYSPRLELEYIMNPHVRVGLDARHEWTASDIPGTPSREYQRQVVGLRVNLIY